MTCGQAIELATDLGASVRFDRTGQEGEIAVAVERATPSGSRSLGALVVHTRYGHSTDRALAAAVAHLLRRLVEADDAGAPEDWRRRLEYFSRATTRKGGRRF